MKNNILKTMAIVLATIATDARRFAERMQLRQAWNRHVSKHRESRQFRGVNRGAGNECYCRKAAQMCRATCRRMGKRLLASDWPAIKRRLKHSKA